MKKFYPAYVLTALCIISIASADAQQYWQERTPNEANKIITDKSVSRLSFPADFKLFDLNIAPLRQELFSVLNNNGTKNSTLISLPNAAGRIEQFEVFEASNFEPALQARFPEIRCFSGTGVNDKSATLKITISPWEIETMVFRADKETEFIEAYSQDHTVYAVYVSQRNKGSLPWTCTTTDTELASSVNSVIGGANFTASSAGQLKVMRLAQSCNGEYAAYFLASTAGTPADTAKVMAAFNNTLGRCNGVYEKDLALHLNLIASTGKIIYFNPATDPYSTTLSQWNQQLQTAITTNIGAANYDIGHMFGGSGGGGNAGCIGCVCVDPTVLVPLGKGSGITSPADAIPKGDNFDIDYVVHEVGHQLGANHTFTHSNQGGAPVQIEVGSGITIMGYAGITANDFIDHSIEIYHPASIAQIQTNLSTKTCPVTTSLAGTNATPVVAAVPNYTIPVSTPFQLTGSATDGDPCDILTYSWEQNDPCTVAGCFGAGSNAGITKTAGPNFASWLPTVSPTRVFPKLTTILAGLNTTAQVNGDAGMLSEALSSVSRTLKFRLTVRDNSPYTTSPTLKVGQTQFTDMVVTVSNTSGPFVVTSPNTAVSYAPGSTQTVTWNVANTTLAPVSCANVRILYSSDNGTTFTVLVPTTPNDGTEPVIIPVGGTTTARIKIESIGNIFFDISNSNFTVTGTPLPPVYTFTGSGNWNIASNWSKNIMPPANLLSGQIIINHSACGISILNTTQTVTAPASLTVNTGKNLLIPGTLIRN